MARKPSIYQMKVVLDDTHPPIWRRIQVPGKVTLEELHQVLQVVMGWEDYHLHSFTIHGEYYGDPALDEFGELGTKDESRFRLNRLITEEGMRFHYDYDFGDGWEHTLLVEKIFSAEKGIRYPRCVKGKRACPPEDVGGVWGYGVALDAIKNPDHPEHDEYLQWISGEFDPEAFDLEGVNHRLSRIGKTDVQWVQKPFMMDDGQFRNGLIEITSSWELDLPADQQRAFEDLPLRRDTVTLLAYLRDHRVTGTSTKGNLTLKAVHEICEQFVHPPRLEESIGDYVYRVRSEEDVWPLYFIHILATIGGLLSGGPGRKWRLTQLGQEFLEMSAPLQAWALFATWWMEMDWAFVSPYEVREGTLSGHFVWRTLDHLLKLPVESRVLFETFADGLIEDVGLVMPMGDQDKARDILHDILELVVIDPLSDFGILIPEHGPAEGLGLRYKQLLAFQMSPMGRGLLKAIKVIDDASGTEL